jgi:Tfp pilus assembly protein PilX
MRESHRHQQGAALATVTIMLLLLGGLAFAGVRLLTEQRLITGLHAKREQAFRAAEYALTAAEARLSTASSFATPEAVLPGSCGTGESAGYCLSHSEEMPGRTFARFRDRSAAANTSTAGDTAYAPRYVVEPLVDARAGMPIVQPGAYSVPPLVYRVTAVGFDQEDDMARMLEILMRPSP